MTECIIPISGHYTKASSLAALGIKLQQVKLFEPIQRLVRIAQKTVKYSPVDKLYDSFVILIQSIVTFLSLLTV